MSMPYELMDKVKLVPSKNSIKYDNDMPLFDTTSVVLVYANDTDLGPYLIFVNFGVPPHYWPVKGAPKSA